MAFDDTSTDFTDDITVPSGCDLFYAFEIQPFDGTGCTAAFITDFGTFTVTLTVVVEGDQPVTTFSVYIAHGSLAPAGVHNWKIRVTFPGGQVLPYGNGGLLLEAA